MSDPLKFTSASQWRHWLTRHHDKEKEIWVAFAKKGSGKKSITYDEALDEALCFGWVDNLKKAPRHRLLPLPLGPGEGGQQGAAVDPRQVRRAGEGGQEARSRPRREA